jgi:hypothetical protein
MSTEVELQKIAASLQELNRKYDLASQALKSGSTGVGPAFVISILSVVVATATHLFGNEPLFTGTQVVWLIGIVVAGLLVYFAMVFWREFSVRAEISESEKRIDLALGKSVG